MSDIRKVKKELQQKARPEKAPFLQRYFKTGKGEYGHGDVFIGITVPELRKIAHRYIDLSLDDISKLLKDTIHEYRFVALEILVAKYEHYEKEKKNYSTAMSNIENVKSMQKKQKGIVTFYFLHMSYINNWDLVDTSAPYIVGHYMYENVKERKKLYKLARSKNTWERRISIVSTFYLIGKEEFKDTLAIAELLLTDAHDLIHKSVGWMLREVGKRSPETLEMFLNTHALKMPRTMLRYAIERFTLEKRMRYMKIR